MPPARSLLLDAASSYALDSEDRLTDLFATTLSGNEALAIALAHEAGLELRGPVTVSTQLRLQSGPQARPDMQLAGTGPNGALVWAWIENKISAPLTEAQARGDPRKLHAHRPPKHHGLILVAADGRECPPGWDKALTWQHVATLADGVGRTALGDRWRDRALKPDAEARWRPWPSLGGI